MFFDPAKLTLEDVILRTMGQTKDVLYTDNCKLEDHPRVCLKTVKVTRQGYRQDRQQHGNRELSSHIWWQSGGCF